MSEPEMSSGKSAPRPLITPEFRRRSVFLHWLEYRWNSACLKKGLPGHFGGQIKEAIHELVKEEILILKPTSYGLHTSLNPRKREEIQRYLT